MSNPTITGNQAAGYTPQLPALTTESKGHADVFNAYFKALLDNDAAIYAYIDGYSRDIEAAIKCNKTEVTVTHSMDSYPTVNVVMEAAFGSFGFGEGGFGGTLRQVPTLLEYVDTQTVILYLSEEIDGEPTVAAVAGVTGAYTATFADGTVIRIKLTP